jgi:hypothetical protein
MGRSRFALGMESKEKNESSKKRREGLAVKCEQFRRLFGAEVSLTISIPSTSGPEVHFAYFSKPDSTNGLSAPAGQYHRSTILKPDSFEDVTDSEGSSIVENSVIPRAKVTKIRIKRVTRDARLRKVPVNAVDQGLAERFTFKQPEFRDFDSSSLSNPSSLHHIKLPGFEIIDRLSRESLTNPSTPLSLRLPSLDPSTNFPWV